LRIRDWSSDVCSSDLMLNVRFRNGRNLGKVEERFAASLRPGDSFLFAGMTLEVEQIRDMDLLVRASTRAATIPSYGGQRLPLSTHLAGRVRELLTDRAGQHGRGYWREKGGEAG